MGAGTTAVAAPRNERDFIGFDTDQRYVDAATARVEEERERLSFTAELREHRRVELPAIPQPAPADENPMSRAVREGAAAKELARVLIEQCEFEDIVEKRRFRSGVEVDFTARDLRGRRWYFDVSGAFTSSRAGLRRTDTIWKALGKAAVLQGSSDDEVRLLLLTTDLPPVGSAGFKAIRAARGGVIVDAIEMLTAAGQERLRRYASGDVDEPVDELLAPAE
jgi:hypothetical protein